MNRIVATLLACMACCLPAAWAEEPILVELFSSQNCAACPKAHRTLKQVEAERGDVLVITWSVDYWDYLGGKDPMAINESKERQRGYVDRFRLRGPYTPQTVYGGVEQCAGNKPSRVENALARTNEYPASGVVLQRDEDGIRLSGTVNGLADIWFVEFLSGEDNPTDMVHPVMRVEAKGPWLGGPVTLAEPDCESGCALIVQEAGFGPVLAALDISN